MRVGRVLREMAQDCGRGWGCERGRGGWDFGEMGWSREREGR